MYLINIISSNLFLYIRRHGKLENQKMETVRKTVMIVKLSHMYEIELHWLDMLINTKKSCCMRIGPVYTCNNITCFSGLSLSWINEIRQAYLSIFVKDRDVLNFRQIMPNVLSTVLPTLFSDQWEELPQRKSFCSYYKVNAFLYYYTVYRSLSTEYY